MKLDLKDYIVILVIIVIALSAGVLSAYQYYDGVKKDNHNDEIQNKLIEAQQKALNASEEISAAQHKTLELSEQLKVAQDQNIAKANDLIVAQAKINELQDETIKQVTGDGYPRLNLMNSIGPNFDFSINGNSEYPIFNVNTRITDSEKLLACKHKNFPNRIELDKSCYDSSILFRDSNPTDLSGTVMFFLHLSLPKKNYYLASEFLCKNIRVVQYSIIKYDGEKVDHSYRIYEVSKSDNSYVRILENNNYSIPESEYQKYFFFKKPLIVDFSK